MGSRSNKLALLGGAPTVTHQWPSYPQLGAEETAAAVKVVMSGRVSDPGRGNVVATMEDRYAEYFGSRHCLSLGSGTAAIHAALFAVGAGPGTEVLTCAHNWVSAIMAVFHAGATPILCDVKPHTFHLDPAEIRRKVTANTKAVIVTHLWGVPADLDPLLKVARELKLAVIEDVSHAHGARYKGKLCGTFGDVGAFSLQGSKSIVAGEGGFLLTDRRSLYQRAIVVGHHTMRLANEPTSAQLKPFTAAGGMWTYRIAPVSAAIATEQLAKLDTMNAARQANFDQLRAGVKGLSFIHWPRLARGSVRGWYGTPARFDAAAAGISRDTFVAACAAEGAGVAGEGYCDWSQTPVLQQRNLLHQLVVAEHANGVAFRPVAAGSLPNYDRLRPEMLLFHIPHLQLPLLTEQRIAAMHRVADQLPALAAYERKQRRPS